MDVEEQLAEDALQNPYLRAYIEAVKKAKASRVAYTRVNHDYSSLKKVIAEGGKVPLSVGKKLSQADLQALAFDLVVETDEAKLNQYLRIFAFVAFPLAFDHLLPYLNHPDSDVVFRAIQALRHFKAEQLRQMAIDNLSQPEFDSDYLELLVENYQPEDCGLIERVLSTIQDEEVFHSAAPSALKIFEKHLDNDCLAPLVGIYNRGSCGHCREQVIEIMIKNNTLPAYIQEEGLYDSNLDIRKLLQSGANNKS